MRGEATPSPRSRRCSIGLRVKGETPDEVAGAARRAARRDGAPRRPSGRDDLVDTCGTGGGAVSTFNISTAAALLAAGAGVRDRQARQPLVHVAVRQRRRARGARRPDRRAASQVMERALREAGIVFMFAPLMHPAMRHVGPVRRELGIPTVMNIVGPLANPARAGRQVVGVADARARAAHRRRAARARHRARARRARRAGNGRDLAARADARDRDPRRRTRASGRSIRRDYGFADGPRRGAGRRPAGGERRGRARACSRDVRRRRRAPPWCSTPRPRSTSPAWPTATSTRSLARVRGARRRRRTGRARATARSVRRDLSE